MSARHHERLHEHVPSWHRRAVARNTGVKCERSEWGSGPQRRALRSGRNAARRAADQRAVHGGLSE